MASKENGSDNGENLYDKDKLLGSLFYNIDYPLAYGSLSKIYRYIRNNKKYEKYKLTKKYIANWLSKQEIYGVHRQARRRFNRVRVLSFSKGYLWDLDTASMVKYKEYNEGFAYFAVFIDIFTRYLYTYPLKTLKGEEMVKAMEVVFQEDQPTHARSDRGSEYVNGNVRSYLKSKNIHHILTSNSQIKANYAERVIRTVKLKLIKYMNHKETYNWVNV